MILDADLTVAPEDLPRFYRAVIDGKGDLVIGSRLVYPVQDQAMRFLNLVGNKVFSWVFTWLLSQRIKDTLCGTKVLTQSAYRRILSHRGHFGDFRSVRRLRLAFRRGPRGPADNGDSGALPRADQWRDESAADSPRADAAANGGDRLGQNQAGPLDSVSWLMRPGRSVVRRDRAAMIAARRLRPLDI